MDKGYRIHTNISSDTVLNVNLKQDFDFLEVLSLKLRQEDVYKLHSSSYGVIIGRVLANDAFGIPNAKVSVFIERDDSDSSEIESIYPYTSVTSNDKDGRRYNLLPDYSDDDCYRVVGTFPNKRLVLDDDTQLEIYGKYWKYTTVTNNAGDYMLFGVPTGSVQVHIDIDLSDIGVLSQRPRDFEYKGYNITMFDSPTQFKESTNLDNLAQLFSQNKSVFVYPFWGDSDNGIAAITRSDVQIQYKFEPTCVFMGAIVSDNDGASIGHKCAPSIDNGMNDQLIGGNGTIEMIRKTTDGLVEEFQIMGNQLIDENGVWCYQIPMNLDYIGTDEYGNIVPTDNPSKGIPTRAQVRFRISKNESGDEGFSRHTAKYLVPMNPIFSENEVIPTIDVKGSEIEKMYQFGSNTPLSCFRDLYWNNVYSVKNYIPKVQVAHRAVSKNYSALKGANLAQDRNEIPFNKLRIDMPFIYIVVCIVFEIIIDIVWLINQLLCVINHILSVIAFVIRTIRRILRKILMGWLARKLPRIEDKLKIYCIPLSAGLEEGNTAFYPGCSCGKKYMGECPSDMDGKCEKTDNTPELRDRVQRNLANDFKIVKLDFYQDWINGALYMPLWYWRKRKKKSFLFGLIHSRAKSEYCSCEGKYTHLKLYTTCEVPYEDENLTVATDYPKGGKMKRWHKKMANMVRFMRGVIKPVTNKDDLTVYYYTAIQATTRNEGTETMAMEDRESGFEAVRLYATDIILLGNLNEDNIYGIPQFFKCLPPTTANVPPIATIEESNEEEEEEVDYEKISESEASESDESGNTLTTGMDWGNKKDAVKTTPQYKKGLFMDLSCTYASTFGKSCINVERLSELGVSLDMAYKTNYSNSTSYDIQEGDFDTDGFINKLELDDMENRSMFATLNHIGFIPQPYQQEHNAYTTQVYDTNTNYLVPKFKYIYPVDFDGRQEKFMVEYNRDKFLQPLYDEVDDSYITFRLGAPDSANGERIRHFYITPKYSSKNWYQMPLYNNSYYFFFGIRKGSTAIDKFNKMFLSECFRNDKKPFTIDIDKRGRSYCPSMYSKKGMGYGYIRIVLEDIISPYKYVLKDENGNVVSSGENMGDEFFVVGGSAETKTSDVTILPESGNDITNQVYTLEVTDNNGKRLTERIELSKDKINANYEIRHLSTRFYDSASTRIDYICNDENNFYGIIDMTNLTIDGYECYITGATFNGYDANANTYSVCLSGTSQYSPNDSNNEAILSAITVYAEIALIESGNTKEYLCDCQNEIATQQGASANMKITEADDNAKVYGGLHKLTKLDNDGNEVLVTNVKGQQAYSLRWFVYQPSDFVLNVTQVCPCTDNEKVCGGCLIEENMSSSNVSVHNGQNFNTYLNTMPTRFIIGTINDNKDAKIGNESYFYNTSLQTSTTNDNICGWYGVHQEDSYQFSRYPTTDVNTRVWEDYITMNDNIETPYIKREILRYKFRTMFNLSDAVYNTTDSYSTFVFDRTGGRERVILRNISPDYADESQFSSNWYIFTDGNRVSIPNEYPNIVGYNYLDDEDEKINGSGPQFNYYWKGNKDKLGNYFGGFDNNASYVTNTKIDGVHIGIQRQPNFASISPINELKPKGRDIKKQIQNFELAYKKGNQMLEGDISRDVNPWLRALTVDRRIDYDLVILGPANVRGFNLYPETSVSGSRRMPTKQKKLSKKNATRGLENELPNIEGEYKLYYELDDGTSGTVECNESDTLSVNDIGTIELPPTKPFVASATKIVLGNCENLSKIGKSCFAGCIHINSVTISSSITYIGWYAFQNCWDLTEIVIPNTVEDIGQGAFMGCASLTSATIDISGDIGKFAFIECPSLTEVTILNARNIGEDAFKGNESLTSVTIDNVSDIGKDAFKGCTSLSIVYLNCNTVPTVGAGAFENTNNCTIKVLEGLEDEYRNAWPEFSDRNICSGDDCQPTPTPTPPSPSGGGSEGGPDYTWKCARIFGRIYNGIEMSYDNEYNVIEANVTRDNETDEVISASSSNTLEYTYEYSSGNTDAKTYYVTTNNHKWEEDGENVEGQIIKRFYDFNFNGIDMRNYLWSDFNKERLNDYVNNTQGWGRGVIQGDGNIYVWHYPSHIKGVTYNSDFNRENVKSGNYPTIRYIDIGNIPPAYNYTMNIDSCSYDMAVGVEDDDTIKAQTEAGEGISFSIEFENIITFIPPVSDNNYGNIEYQMDGCEDGYNKFVATKFNVNFRYNMVSSSEFDVYTSTPRIIGVLYEGGNFDGLSVMKTANPDYEMGGDSSPILGDGIDILDYTEKSNYHVIEAVRNIIDRCAIYRFHNPKKFKIGQFQAQDIIVPNGVIVENMSNREFFRTAKENEIEYLLRSDDSDFENITFSNEKTLNNLGKWKAFTIGCIRLYVSKDRDYEHLAKRVYTVETSDIFDARNLLMKVLTETEDESGNTELKSYVIKQNLTEVDIPEPEPPEPPEPNEDSESFDSNGNVNEHLKAPSRGDDESGSIDVGNDGDDEGGGSGEGGGSSTSEPIYVYIQVLTFEMYFNCDPTTNPADLQNQVFANHDMMAFIFIFKNAANEQYEIQCNEFETEVIDDVKLKVRFILRWTQDMGLLMDEKWEMCNVTLYVKSTSSSSNFVYKVNDIWLKHPEEDEKPSEEGYSGATITNTYILPGCDGGE